MDGSRFDRLTRTLTTTGSRRRAVSGVLAGAFGLVGSEAEHAAARKKKPCPPCTTRKKGKCKANLPDGATCPDGTCQGGRCVAAPPPPSCPSGQRLCRGSCLSTLICCDNTDCAGGRTCQQGTCACPLDKSRVCAGSTVCAQCCVTTDCRPDGNDDGQVCQNGQCVCTDPTTRRCPSGVCGRCCSDAECPGAETCLNLGPMTGPPQCRCYVGAVCDINGESICVPSGCASKCPGASCLNPGGTCCEGKGALRCYANQGGGGTCDF